MNGVDYSKAVTPDGYRCDNCGVTGVKLWRECQTISPKLLCVHGAADDQRKSIDDIDADGMRSSELGGRTDQIGWYVPAIPDEEGVGYWGYTSVPQAGVNWWRNLPTEKQGKKRLGIWQLLRFFLPDAGWYRYTSDAREQETAIEGPFPTRGMANPLCQGRSGVGLTNFQAKWHFFRPKGAKSVGTLPRLG